MTGEQGGRGAGLCSWVPLPLQPAPGGVTQSQCLNQGSREAQQLASPASAGAPTPLGAPRGLAHTTVLADPFRRAARSPPARPPMATPFNLRLLPPGLRTTCVSDTRTAWSVTTNPEYTLI